MPKIYISNKTGSDSTGNGSQQKPFASIPRALKLCTASSDAEIYVESNSSAGSYDLLAAQQLEKYMKDLKIVEKKEESLCEKALEAAKSIVIQLDPKLSQPIKTKISGSYLHVGKRVVVCGWVNSIRRQGTKLMFLIVRDGTGNLQCVLSNALCQTHDALLLTTESTITAYGVINQLPPCKFAPGGVEMSCDYWELMYPSPPGGLEATLNKDSNPDTQLNQRHLYLRTPEMCDIMKVRSRVLQAFRDHYFSKNYYEVTPPTIVQTQCEGGSTLFKFNYFGDTAYLTQSSQLYLETVLPSLGSVYCISQSYRAETSKTRRHLAEYTHVEAEIPFIYFDELLQSLEDLICDVVDRILSSDVSQIVKRMNPTIGPFKRPFRRMLYSDAIEYLKKNDICKDDGSFYEFGQDIPEAPERKMTDQIGEPIFLIKFPAEIKSFYMKRDPDDRRLTESVDLLLPGVGEVIGGSMRMAEIKELLEAYKTAGINSDPYYWYTEQRKYGSCEHGGYGLGLERFLTWLLNRHHIRDACLYPRFVGRCTP